MATESYGGESARLLVLTLKRATNILNLTEASTADELAKLQAVSSAQNCDTHGYGPMTLVGAARIFRSSKSSACRSTFIDALARLHVQVIFYPYTAANGMSGCRLRNEAMNIIDAQAIDTEQSLYDSSSTRWGAGSIL